MRHRPVSPHVLVFLRLIFFVAMLLAVVNKLCDREEIQIISKHYHNDYVQFKSVTTVSMQQVSMQKSLILQRSKFL